MFVKHTLYSMKKSLREKSFLSDSISDKNGLVIDNEIGTDYEDTDTSSSDYDTEDDDALSLDDFVEHDTDEDADAEYIWVETDDDSTESECEFFNSDLEEESTFP